MAPQEVIFADPGLPAPLIYKGFLAAVSKGFLYSGPLLKCLACFALRKCHSGCLSFADGDGHVGTDAMTIPDYVAVAVLIMLMLCAVAGLSRGKFEL